TRVERERFTKCNDDVPTITEAAIQQGSFITQFASRTRECAAPQTPQIKRHNHGVFNTFNCALITGMKFSEVTVATDGAFGEEANNFTVAQQGVDTGQRFFAVAGRNRNHAQSIQQRLEIPAIVNLPL